ncbi:MAG: hypothetical protein AAF720_09780 [Pseudomonadota bacterium]
MSSSDPMMSVKSCDPSENTAYIDGAKISGSRSDHVRLNNSVDLKRKRPTSDNVASSKMVVVTSPSGDASALSDLSVFDFVSTRVRSNTSDIRV